jgi:hypothetical protein
MTSTDRIQLAKDFYKAFMSGDRTWYEEHLSDDLVFSSPVDVGLDRAGYFERCWPGSGHGGKLEFVRLLASGDEVIVTYESAKPDGSKGRNTEILGFQDSKLRSVEVYFGWDVPASRSCAAR